MVTIITGRERERRRKEDAAREYDFQVKHRSHDPGDSRDDPLAPGYALNAYAGNEHRRELWQRIKEAFGVKS